MAPLRTYQNNLNGYTLAVLDGMVYARKIGDRLICSKYCFSPFAIRLHKSRHISVNITKLINTPTVQPV